MFKNGWQFTSSPYLEAERLPLFADATGADEGIGRDDRGSETELAKGAEAGPEWLIWQKLINERILVFHMESYVILDSFKMVKRFEKARYLDLDTVKECQTRIWWTRTWKVSIYSTI